MLGRGRGWECILKDRCRGPFIGEAAKKKKILQPERAENGGEDGGGDGGEGGDGGGGGSVSEMGGLVCWMLGLFILICDSAGAG